MIIDNKILRTPQNTMQANRTNPNNNGQNHIEPHIGHNKSHHGHQTEPNNDGPVVENDEVEEVEGLVVVAGKVEEVPGGEEGEEDEHGEGVVDEGEEEDEEEDEGVVEEEVGEVVGEARGGVGEGGREGEG